MRKAAEIIVSEAGVDFESVLERLEILKASTVRDRFSKGHLYTLMFEGKEYRFFHEERRGLIIDEQKQQVIIGDGSLSRSVLDTTMIWGWSDYDLLNTASSKKSLKKGYYEDCFFFYWLNRPKARS
jgi:hypothetical protein